MALHFYKKILGPTKKKIMKWEIFFFFSYLVYQFGMLISSHIHFPENYICLSPLEANKIPLCLHAGHIFLIHHLLTVA